MLVDFLQVGNGEWERDVQGLCKAKVVNQGLKKMSRKQIIGNSLNALGEGFQF